MNDYPYIIHNDMLYALEMCGSRMGVISTQSKQQPSRIQRVVADNSTVFGLDLLNLNCDYGINSNVVQMKSFDRSDASALNGPCISLDGMSHSSSTVDAPLTAALSCYDSTDKSTSFVPPVYASYLRHDIIRSQDAYHVVPPVIGLSGHTISQSTGIVPIDPTAGLPYWSNQEPYQEPYHGVQLPNVGRYPPFQPLDSNPLQSRMYVSYCTPSQRVARLSNAGRGNITHYRPAAMPHSLVQEHNYHYPVDSTLITTPRVYVNNSQHANEFPEFYPFADQSDAF